MSIRMIICFGEKDKAAIEARGMTVIEAKRILYKFIKVLCPVLNRLWDICKNMSKEEREEFLKENGVS